MATEANVTSIIYATTKEPETVLNVAGEGGGYTILGELHQGKWRFWLDPSESSSWMYDELDRDVTASRTAVTIDEARPSAIRYYSSLEEALEQINACWPHLHPIQVHTSFSEKIWRLVVEFCKANRGARTNRLLPKWGELCLGREVSSLEELGSPDAS